MDNGQVDQPHDEDAEFERLEGIRASHAAEYAAEVRAVASPMVPIRELVESLKFSIASDEEIAEHERIDRLSAARAIRDRMPEFLRAPISALRKRVIDQRMLDAATSWVPGEGSVLFCGPTTIGKTTAAAVLFLRQIGRGVRLGGEAWGYAQALAWFHAGELERARHEHPIGRGEAPELIEASFASLSVIDDLGWERDPQACSIVIAERYDRARPTLVTTALTEHELIERYSEAVIRRLTQVGGLTPVMIVPEPAEFSLEALARKQAAP